ncbi:MAG: hypothetical protein A3J83_05205 [Elusimicrobia bacterium RIFOXYA2_FULL_40_6]|nr:MAG: hypothetical protein A3J83_05205 [Elusimicrobia bacterium RIFOXYA2_FULL_40_6]
MLYNKRAIKIIDFVLICIFVLFLFKSLRDLFFLLSMYFKDPVEYNLLQDSSKELFNFMFGDSIYVHISRLIIICITLIGAIGLLKFREWGRKVLIFSLLVIIFKYFYMAMKIFNIEIFRYYNDPVFDLSKAYVKFIENLGTSILLSLVVYYFSIQKVRECFRANKTQPL